MLDELLGVVADLTHTVQEACGPCAGNPPNAGPTLTGAGGAGAAGGGGGGGGGDRRRGGGEESDRPWHEERDHERQMQRDNAEETAKDLIWEFVTSPGRSIGKVLGPLTVVASGSEVLADGVSTVTEANQRREEQLYEQTGGEMGTPPSGGGQRDVAESGGGQGDTSGQRDGGAGSSQDDAGRREAERTLEDIRIKLEIERNGYGDDDSWKDWGR